MPASLAAATCGEAPVHAYAAIDVIEWPDGFRRRDTGWGAFARDPAQLDRITPGWP
jgi:phosphoribosylamine-glycine ligase